MKLFGYVQVREPRNAPPSESMPERIPAPLEEKFRKRLAFYQDIGIDLFYRDRFPQTTRKHRRGNNVAQAHSKIAAREASQCTSAAGPKINGAPSFVRCFSIRIHEQDRRRFAPKILADIGDCTAANCIVAATSSSSATEIPTPARFVGEGPAAMKTPKVCRLSAARENC